MMEMIAKRLMELLFTLASIAGTCVGPRKAGCNSWWFATVRTPGAEEVIGLQTEVEGFEGRIFEMDEVSG
jgi:hypothetical protein